MPYRTGSAQTYTGNPQATNTFAINAPVGVAAGDTVVILSAAVANNAQYYVTSPGFTQANDNHTGTQAQGPPSTMTILTKIAGGSEPATYTCTFASGNPNNTLIAFCASWTAGTGASSSTFTATAGSGLPQSIALAGVGGLMGLNDLIWWAFSNTESGTFTAPAGFNATGVTVNVTGLQSAFMTWQDSFSGASTGTLTGSVNGTGNTDQRGFVIALAQGGGGAGPIIMGQACL